MTVASPRADPALGGTGITTPEKEIEECFTITVCENNITQLEEQFGKGNEVVTIRILTANPAWFVEQVGPLFEVSKDGMVKIEFIKVPLPDLAKDVINEAKSKVGLYDGFIISPQIAGSIVEYDGWADLNPYIHESVENTREWSDILIGYRSYMAQYEGKIIMFPLDGDILSLYYRKDILEYYGFDHPPRTWDEYEQVAKTIHGQVYENKTLVGSCVSRRLGCGGVYWSNLLLASMTQTLGPWQGHLLDTANMEPLTESALEQVLAWLERQVEYGAEGEFDGCINQVNSKYMKDGVCALTYNWGNSFKSYLQDGDQLRGRFSVAPTPGSTKVLDRETKQLVNCDEERCRHGDYYDDIGWVNRAPYLAFGGWACSVSNYTDPVKKRLTTEFCAFASSQEESTKTIISDARGEHTGGQDPYRRSHLNVDLYVKQGYEREVAQDFINVIQEGIESPNLVTDIRFPTASKIMSHLDAELFIYLNDTKHRLIPEAERLVRRRRFVKNVTDEWIDIIATYNAEGSTQVNLLESYQRLRGVYTPTVAYHQIESIRSYGIVLACIVCLCSAVFALWTICNRKHRVVKASQPFFLVMICFGTIVLGSAVFPMAIDDSSWSEETCSKACMTVPWLLALGWTIVFSALFAKLWLLNRVVKGAKRFERVKLSNSDVLWPFGILFTINVTVLSIWTSQKPIHWKRIWINDAESYGTCSLGFDGAAKWEILLITLVSANVLALIMANWQAYIARNISTEYGESSYIGMVMGSFLQLNLVGTPSLFLVEENPSASYFLKSSIIFVLCMSVLLFMFVPKMYAWRSKQKSETKNLSAAASSRRPVVSFADDGHSTEGRAHGSTATLANKQHLKEQFARLKKRLLAKHGQDGGGGVDFHEVFDKVGLIVDATDAWSPITGTGAPVSLLTSSGGAEDYESKMPMPSESESSEAKHHDHQHPVNQSLHRGDSGGTGIFVRPMIRVPPVPTSSFEEQERNDGGGLLVAVRAERKPDDQEKSDVSA